MAVSSVVGMKIPIASLLAISGSLCLISCQHHTDAVPTQVTEVPPPKPVAQLPQWTSHEGKTRGAGRTIRFSTKILEIARTDKADLPRDVYKRKLTTLELKNYMRNAAETKGIDLLTAPAITAREGKVAQSQIGRQLILPVKNASTITAEAFVGLTHFVRARPKGKNLVVDFASRHSLLPDGPPPTNINDLEVAIMQTPAQGIELAEGESFLLGGFVKETEQRVEDKVPVLGDIPLVGYAFRNQSTNTFWRELVVIVTPTVVDGR